MKSKLFLFTMIIFSLHQNIFGQSAWKKVNTDLGDKLSNICFVNQDTGFAYGSHETNGKIYRTINGGKNWEITTTNNNNLFSSIFFINKNIGWILGSNSTGNWPNWITKVVVYKTTNSGESWDLLFNDTITNSPNKIQFINSDIGWILDYENNCLLKSINSGATWEKYNFNLTSRAIVDFCFLNDSIGFCCYQGIFKTTDGGKTWIKKKNRLTYGDFHCIQFVNDSVGWAAGMAIYKTEDAGETWVFQKKLGTYSSGYNTDACYFLDENKGFVGSKYITLDGGNTWTEYDPGVLYLGSFCFVNESIGFALYQGELYKTITGGILTSVSNTKVNKLPFKFELQQNYPNPFNPQTTIKYNLIKSNNVELKIYNLFGQAIETLVNEFQTASEHEINWQPKGLSSGVYFYKLHVGDFSETKKLLLQK